MFPISSVAAHGFLLGLVSGVGWTDSDEDSSDEEDFLSAFKEHERLLPKPAMTPMHQEQAAFVLHTGSCYTRYAQHQSAAA